MPFWIPPLWFGRQATIEGGGTRLPALTNIRLGVPVHTRLIEVLSEELPEVEVWPDVDQTTSDSDSIVVQNAGGEWLTQSNAWQQLNRSMRILVFSKTSNGAEELLDKVATIIKRRHDAFRLITASNIPGGMRRKTKYISGGWRQPSGGGCNGHHLQNR